MHSNPVLFRHTSCRVCVCGNHPHTTTRIKHTQPATMSEFTEEDVEMTAMLRCQNLRHLRNRGGWGSASDAVQAEALIFQAVCQAAGGFQVYLYTHYMFQLYGAWQQQQQQTYAAPSPPPPHAWKTAELAAMYERRTAPQAALRRIKHKTDMTDYLDPAAARRVEQERICPRCKQETVEPFLLQQRRGDELSDAYNVCTNPTCNWSRKLT